MDIESTTGDAYLTNITCNNLSSKGSTGYIKFSNVILTGKLYIERTSGDVTLDQSDANEIEIKNKQTYHSYSGIGE